MPSIAVRLPATWQEAASRATGVREFATVARAGTARSGRGTHDAERRSAARCRKRHCPAAQNVHAEHVEPATYLEIGGWPALERVTTVTESLPGNDNRSAARQVLKVTTAIAMGDQLVRFQGVLQRDVDARVARERLGIGRDVALVVVRPKGAADTTLQQLRTAPRLTGAELPSSRATAPKALASTDKPDEERYRADPAPCRPRRRQLGNRDRHVQRRQVRRHRLQLPRLPDLERRRQDVPYVRNGGGGSGRGSERRPFDRLRGERRLLLRLHRIPVRGRRQQPLFDGDDPLDRQRPDLQLRRRCDDLYRRWQRLLSGPGAHRSRSLQSVGRQRRPGLLDLARNFSGGGCGGTGQATGGAGHPYAGLLERQRCDVADDARCGRWGRRISAHHRRAGRCRLRRLSRRQQRHAQQVLVVRRRPEPGGRAFQ